MAGGAMFLVLTFEAQVLPFVAFEIYKKSGDVENKLDLEELETALRVLAGTWAINVLLFFMLIKRKYRKTFWDPQTGERPEISERAEMLQPPTPLHDYANPLNCLIARRSVANGDCNLRELRRPVPKDERNLHQSH